MKNKTKFFALLSIIVTIALSFALTGCWDSLFAPSNSGNNASDNNSNNSDDEDTTLTIDLTMDNYDYYLSIDKVHISTSNTAIRVETYKVTINGAIGGLYTDCILYYKIGAEGDEKQIKLNAAGFATFSYGTTGAATLQFTKVEGQIIIG